MTKLFTGQAGKDVSDEYPSLISYTATDYRAEGSHRGVMIYVGQDEDSGGEQVILTPAQALELADYIYSVVEKTVTVVVKEGAK